MSRATPFFGRRSPDSTSESFLPQYNDAHSLADLSPRPSTERNVSASPPPSFYRSQNPAPKPNYISSEASSRTHSVTGLSPEPTSPQQRRKIQFAAPPAPIAQSVLLHHEHSKHGKEGQASAGRNGDTLSGSVMMSASGYGTRRKKSGSLDALLGLERREKAIQKDLQDLLDLQSAGLVQGFGGGGGSGGRPSATDIDGLSDAGSSTPTSRSVLLDRNTSQSRERTRGGVMPVRQPKKRSVGLRGARRGLLRDMGELVDIKIDESALIDLEINRREDALKNVEVWEKRISGFGIKLRSATEDGEDNRVIAELRSEQKAVDTEIREMEDRLLQMRARKRWLGERINETVNKKEARLSSYRGALRDAETEVKEFLRRPPVEASPISTGEEESFMALPPNRRTLGMAKEWWTKEISALEERRKEIELEKEALEEGAKIWEASMQSVMEFEDDLRTQMKIGVDDPEALKRQVAKMGSVISDLAANLKIAEEKHWNLLICAVGAEVEAFREGENILRGALGMPDSKDLVDVQPAADADVHVDEGVELDVDNEGDSVREGLEQALQGTIGSEGTAESNELQLRKLTSLEREVTDSSEDDGPPAELMFDHYSAA
ncbi:hypothetical protein BP6252_07196 [Coleophoma cylindrospora]|uniref:Autophagy-related protein 28 n=1 Tax=Coleophoma cylindrospora TaxID=1849047 RepID=A0A3D8RGW2_9HELO|nr:hypothetical protein BP6252_07196 [Coleophoma cylindrospora]